MKRRAAAAGMHTRLTVPSRPTTRLGALSAAGYNRRMSDGTLPSGKHALKFVTLCGRTYHNTDPQYFPRAEYRGRILYFCTDSCLGAFQADPARFYVAHRRSAHKSGPRFN